MKVNFLIIGAQKCGTTTLFNILDKHPSIVGSRPKEPHFFSRSNDWKKDLPEYDKNFMQKDGALYFEASTTYTFYPFSKFNIWDDIFEYNPNMKLIYLVRNPIDRIVSSYMHAFETGYVDSSIEEAVINVGFFIDITRYSTQIRPYIRKFGRGNVLIVDFDDLNCRRESVLRKISRFLSVDFESFSGYENEYANVSIGGKKRHHEFSDPSLRLRLIRKFLPSVWDKVTDNSKRSFEERPVLTTEYKQMIINMLDLEIQELQSLMNNDLSDWMSTGNSSFDGT